MPKFEVELHDGRKFEVEADSPPTEEEMLPMLDQAPVSNVGAYNRQPLTEGSFVPEQPMGGGSSLVPEVDTPPANVKDVLNKVVELLGKGVVGAVNLPTSLANRFRGAGPGDPDYTEPAFQQGKPLLKLGTPFSEEEAAQYPPALQAMSGVFNKVLQTGEGLTTPEMVFSAPALGLKPIQALLAAQIGANVPGQVEQSAKTFQDPTASTMQKAESVAEPVIGGVMTGAIGRHLVKGVEAPKGQYHELGSLADAMEEVAKRIRERSESSPAIEPQSGAVPSAPIGPQSREVAPQQEIIPPVIEATTSAPEAPISRQVTSTPTPNTGLADELNILQSLPERTPAQDLRIKELFAADQGKAQKEAWQAQFKKDLEAKAPVVAESPTEPLMPEAQRTALASRQEEQFSKINNARRDLLEMKEKLRSVNLPTETPKETGDVEEVASRAKELTTPPTEDKPLPPGLDEIAAKVADKNAERLTPQELDIVNALGKDKETQRKYFDKVKELRRNKIQAPMASTPKILKDEARLGIKPNKQGFYDGSNLVNRVRNVAPKTEVEMLEEAGLSKWEGKKVKAEEFEKWVGENGPRVEVRKAGNYDINKESQKLSGLEHELDTAGITAKYNEHGDTITGWQYNGKNVRSSDMQGPHAQKMVEMEELYNSIKRDTAVANWSSVAPRPESELKDYTEIATVKPYMKKKMSSGKLGGDELVDDSSAQQFPSTHSFPPNTIGWNRVYTESLPHDIPEMGLKKGEEGTASVEVQSDWAQQVHKAKEKLKEGGQEGRGRAVERMNSDDPLLAHHERLAIKNQIEHAREKGHKWIFVPDAETAMMTEGHDRMMTRDSNTPYHSKELAEKDAVELRKQGVKVEISQSPTGTSWILTQKGSIPQEGGMRLHYEPGSGTLHRIASELTGSKGQRVEFGEHKMAFEEGFRGGNNPAPYPMEVPRKDLIFRNPDGTLKTKISGVVYPIEKARNEFSLFAKDKPGSTFSPQSPKEVPPEHATELKEMGFGTDVSAHDVLSNIAAKPEVFGKEKSGFASFLTRHFPNVLKVTKLSEGIEQGASGASYNPFEHTVYMGLRDESGFTPAEKILHEAAHAATVWALDNSTTAEQFQAVKAIEQLRAVAIAKLSPEDSAFFNEKFKPAMDSYSQGIVDKSIWQSAGDKGGLYYALHNNKEFVAGLFSDQAFREHLNSIKVGETTVWGKIKDAIKTLLGIEPGSALNEAFESVIELGEHAGEGGTVSTKIHPPGFIQLPPKPSTPGTAVLKDLTLKDRVKGQIAKWAGYSAPKTVATNEELGNALVRYASARVSAPEVARSLASEVLEDKWKDKNFDKVLGAVIVEDQLRGVKKGFEDAAAKATDPAEKQELLDKAANVQTLVKQPYSPFRNEADYQRFLNNPEMKAAIDRHKDLIQPRAEEAHVELGGKLARGGEQTGAFANLIAILSPDDVETTRSMVYGSARGNLSNPLQRTSTFGKQRSGTAWMYDTSYRNIAERMIRGNYEELAKQEMYNFYVKSGLGVVQKPGEAPPSTAGGKRLTKVEIKRRGAGPGQTSIHNLWVRPDLAPELYQALHTDRKYDKGVIGHVLDAASTVQMAGVTDAVWHTTNMMSAISGSQGGKSLLADIARSQHGIGFVDAAARLGHNLFRVMVDSPEVQKELAQIAEVGAGRSPQIHRSLIGKFDPGYWTGKAIHALDKAGRVTLNKMFDNLVERDLVKDTELDRREFINKMGQYNSRLMSKTQEILRENSIAPFVVAGRNFNRLARQRILASPGIRAKNTEAFVKMRGVEALRLASTVIALPIIANYALTGTPFGRPGTHPGSIDTGKNDKDGKVIEYDPLQTSLYRRGLRISGVQAGITGVERDRGGKETTQSVVQDIVDGFLHPWTGPAVRVASIAKFGRDPSGRLQSKNPFDMVENLKAASRELNPAYKSYKEGTEEGASGLKRIATDLGGALGIKKGAYPTHDERADTYADKMEPGKKFSELSIRQKFLVQRQMDKDKTPNPNEVVNRSAAERRLYGDFARQDRLKESLPPDTQQWLDKQKLHLPGFEPELTKAKVRLPLSREQQERSEQIFSSEYQGELKGLMDNKDFENASQQEKQKFLEKRLVMARRRARRQLGWMVSESTP